MVRERRGYGRSWGMGRKGLVRIKTLAAMSRDEAEEQTARRVTEGKMGQEWALNLEEWQGETRHCPGAL